jgi:peroxiredoxin Q/BCP
MNQTPFKAHDFSLTDDSGRLRKLSDYGGKWLVLYFYPKDDTPGCTIQACGLRDARDELMELGVEVVGVSKDPADSHEAFKSKHSLNFTLLSDPDGEVADAYEAIGKTIFDPRSILRKTFLIDPSGTVQKVYKRVIPTGHSAKVVKDLKVLQSV